MIPMAVKFQTLGANVEGFVEGAKKYKEKAKMDSVAPYDRCVECSAGDPLQARTQSTPTTQLGHMERRNPEKAIYFIKKTKKTKCSHSKGFGASWTLGSSRAGRLRSLRRRPAWEILREIRVAEHE